MKRVRNKIADVKLLKNITDHIVKLCCNNDNRLLIPNVVSGISNQCLMLNKVIYNSYNVSYQPLHLEILVTNLVATKRITPELIDQYRTQLQHGDDKLDPKLHDIENIHNVKLDVSKYKAFLCRYYDELWCITLIIRDEGIINDMKYIIRTLMEQHNKMYDLKHVPSNARFDLTLKSVGIGQSKITNNLGKDVDAYITDVYSYVMSADKKTPIPTGLHFAAQFYEIKDEESARQYYKNGLAINTPSLSNIDLSGIYDQSEMLIIVGDRFYYLNFIIKYENSLLLNNGKEEVVRDALKPAPVQIKTDSSLCTELLESHFEYSKIIKDVTARGFYNKFTTDDMVEFIMKKFKLSYTRSLIYAYACMMENSAFCIRHITSVNLLHKNLVKYVTTKYDTQYKNVSKHFKIVRVEIVD